MLHERNNKRSNKSNDMGSLIQFWGAVKWEGFQVSCYRKVQYCTMIFDVVYHLLKVKQKYVWKIIQLKHIIFLGCLIYLFYAFLGLIIVCNESKVVYTFHS